MDLTKEPIRLTLKRQFQILPL